MWPHEVRSCAHSFSDAGGRPNSSTASAELLKPAPTFIPFYRQEQNRPIRRCAGFHAPKKTGVVAGSIAIKTSTPLKW
jgi:hypothetical protein